jgi:DNA primase (bacterial type)
MPIDFNALKDIAGQAVTPTILKRELSLPWLVEQHGVELEKQGNRLVGECPFHQDRKPSFTVFVDPQGFERWSCMPCGESGDQLDFLKKKNPTASFSEQLQIASGMLIGFQQDGAWEPAQLDTAPTLTREVAAEVVAEAQEHSAVEAVERLRLLKDMNFDSEWVVQNFKLGMLGSKILAPYYDGEGAYAYKTRYPRTGTKWFAADGAKFLGRFYGANAERGSSTRVVLVEGESDTWSTSYALRDDPTVSVLGLSTGATSPVVTESLAGLDVTLAFDGDAVGRKALRTWYKALTGIAKTISVLPLPDGFDLSRLPSVADALDRARLVLPYSGRVRSGAVFELAGKEDAPAKALCNWGFIPERELRGKGVAYEGTITTTGERAVLSANDLSSKANIVRWSNAHGLGWTGTDKDAQEILMWLESEGPFLSPGNMTEVLGLHNGNFVLPDSTIGPDYWRYVPEKVVPTEELHISPHRGGLNVLAPMLEFNDLSVVSPLIAWLAAAPIRAMLREFPIMAVTGSAGTGKTVMIEFFCKAFAGGFLGTSLSGTTPFAISAFVGGTNGIPVWFDEARAGIRQDTKDHMAQVLRAAYSGQTTHKGSVASGSLALDSYSALAPIIVSGEDSFTETSHIERMILVQMPRKGKDPKALEALRAALPSGFAHDYLSWLVWEMHSGNITTIGNYEFGPDNLASRQRLSLGVLDLGWKLLGWYLESLGDFRLPKPDWSGIIQQALEANSSDPFRESILWALDNLDRIGPIVWKDEHFIYVRPNDLVSEINRQKLFILPGGAKAMANHLISLGGVQGRYERNQYLNDAVAAIRLPIAYLSDGMI